MKRSALYARVSTDRQKEEGTIESQIAELKRQIAAAGDELVKEYIDDGHSGKYLDRPALDELRNDLKTDAFDAVYFLCADRIARDLMHQNIIVGELLKHKKRIIISCKDYEENPENKFALSVFGAVAEFERAKIAERMTRGKLHRLRTGQLLSHGHTIYGYAYAKKTESSPPALVVNEAEAKIVRMIFEMYASGQFGPAAISRFLEAHGIPTRKGNLLWDQVRITQIMKNTTYTGTRYHNRSAIVTEVSKDGKRAKTPKREYRAREEWIAVKVPAIVSQELFDRAQEQLRISASRYRNLPIRALLCGFVRCADCGRLYASAYSYAKIVQPSGAVSVCHRGQYRCTRTNEDRAHHSTQRCRNVRVESNIFDGTVVEMIRAVMFDPDRLGRCIESGSRVDDPSAAAELSRIAGEINGLNDKRRAIFEAYATEQMNTEEYIAASRALDEALVRVKGEKAAVVNAARDAGWDDAAAASIRHFCASARTRFEACADFDAKRAFLRDHVERIVFNHGKLSIFGSVPLQGAAQRSLPFRIDGAIDAEIVRTKASRKRWPEDERFGSWVPVRAEHLSPIHSI
jgi:site-specific DNA recombinase